MIQYADTAMKNYADAAVKGFAAAGMNAIADFISGIGQTIVSMNCISQADSRSLIRRDSDNMV